MRVLPSLFFSIILLSFAVTLELRADQLKRFTINPYSSEVILVSRAFEIYSTYDPSSNFSDFKRDNPHLGDVALNTEISLKTPFFVPEKTCKIIQSDGRYVDTQMWYGTFSMEARAARNSDSPTELSGDVLLKIYRVRSRRPEATFSEFIQCNEHLGIRSPSDEISYADKNISVWYVER